MPLQLHYTFEPSGELALWNTTESVEELVALAQPTAEEEALVMEFPLEKRRKEWLTTRILRNLLRPGQEVFYDENGKPFLANEQISISHSGHLAAMCCHPTHAGLDIEKPSDKIVRVSFRFSHPSEIAKAPAHEPLLSRYLTTIWCAKEAVFKCFGVHVHFSQDIILRDFNDEDETIIADYKGIHGEKTFTLRRVMIDGMWVVHVVN